MTVIPFKKQEHSADNPIEAFLMSINSPYNPYIRRWYDNLILERAKEKRQKNEKDLKIAFFPTASYFPTAQSSHISEAERYFSIYTAKFKAIDTRWCYYFFRNTIFGNTLDYIANYLASPNENTSGIFEKFKDCWSQLEGIISEEQGDTLLRQNVLASIQFAEGKFDLEKLSYARQFFDDFSRKSEKHFFEEFDNNVSQISESDIIYVGGGSPEVLTSFFLNSPKKSGETLWHAVNEALLGGAVYAGNSAGAMVVCEKFYQEQDLGGGLKGDLERDVEKYVERYVEKAQAKVVPAFGLVREIGGCIPHYEGRKFEQVRLLAEKSKEPVYGLVNDSLIHAVVRNGETINTFHGTRKPFCVWNTDIFDCATIMH